MQKTLRALLASVACQHAVRAFSAGRAKNDRVILAIGLVAGSVWIVPGLDVFGGVTGLGFHIGEDNTPSDSILVDHSVYVRAKSAVIAGGYGDGRQGMEFVEAPNSPLEYLGKHTKVYTCVFGPPAPLAPGVGGAVHSVDGALAAAMTDAHSKSFVHRILKKGHTHNQVAPDHPADHDHTVFELTEKKPRDQEKNSAVYLKHMCDIARFSVIQQEVNSEEPLDLIMILNDRLQATRPEAKKAADNALMTRFSRAGCTAVVIVIGIAADAVQAEVDDKDSVELLSLALLFKIKAIAEEAAKANGGEMVKAMQERAVRGCFALMPSPEGALALAVLCTMQVKELNAEITEQRGKPSADSESYVWVQIGAATGEVLDLGGFNAFGDPVNTAFKMGEDVAEEWEVLLQDKTMEKLKPERTAPFGFTLHEKSLSKVTLKYWRVKWLDDHVQTNVEGPLMAARGLKKTNRVDWNALVPKE